MGGPILLGEVSSHYYPALCLLFRYSMSNGAGCKPVHLFSSGKFLVQAHEKSWKKHNMRQSQTSKDKVGPCTPRDMQVQNK